MELEKLRKLNGLSKADVAKKLQLPYMTYNNYEVGRNEPNLSTLIKLADFYNITIDYLIGRNFQGDVGYLNEKQRNLLLLIKKLNDVNIEKVASYTAGILAMQD